MTNFFSMWAMVVPVPTQKRWASCPRGAEQHYSVAWCLFPCLGMYRWKMICFPAQGASGERGQGRDCSHPHPAAPQPSKGERPRHSGEGPRAGIEVIPREEGRKMEAKGETREGGCRYTGCWSVHSCSQVPCLITGGRSRPYWPPGSATSSSTHRGCHWLQHVLQTCTWGFTIRSATTALTHLCESQHHS